MTKIAVLYISTSMLYTIYYLLYVIFSIDNHISFLTFPHLEHALYTMTPLLDRLAMCSYLEFFMIVLAALNSFSLDNRSR